MAKSRIGFSLKLLKTDKKYHYAQMKLIKGAKAKGIEYGVTKKSIFNEMEKRYNHHKKRYDDLVIAINILSYSKGKNGVGSKQLE